MRKCGIIFTRKVGGINMSKEWNWEINTNDLWLKPSIESYFYVQEWKNKHFKNILDLGCGLGRHAILFAKNGFNVTACDLSEYGVNHLNEWANKENLKIETGVLQCTVMSFNSGFFKKKIILIGG